MQGKLFYSSLLSIILLTACNTVDSETPTMPLVVETVTSNSFEITHQTLANSTFKTGMFPTGSVTLTGGKYQERMAPGATGIIKIKLLDEFAVGDLNQDGIPDSAVILVTESGGSGKFYELSAATGDENRLIPAASLLLGDRVQIQSISVDNGKITIKMIAHGPDDPMCCPSLEVTQIYQVQGDQIVKIP